MSDLARKAFLTYLGEEKLPLRGLDRGLESAGTGVAPGPLGASISDVICEGGKYLLSNECIWELPAIGYPADRSVYDTQTNKQTKDRQH